MDIVSSLNNNDSVVEYTTEKMLTEDEKKKLETQNSRLVSEFNADQLEISAKKHWDLFYKRNETRFFKDRHWTTREFVELLGLQLKSTTPTTCDSKNKNILLEIGCGVGNLVFPLIEGNLCENFFYYACDFSPRAIQLLKSHSLYNENHIKAFQCDITTDDIFNYIPKNSVNIVTMVFVLSAIHPNKFKNVLNNVYALLADNGILLFRDYGLYDTAQIRFKPGHKIAEKFYMRQDGTRTYYFDMAELSALVTDIGFEILSNSYVHRRTVNKKENIDSLRIFLQGKFRKRTIQL